MVQISKQLYVSDLDSISKQVVSTLEKFEFFNAKVKILKSPISSEIKFIVEIGYHYPEIVNNLLVITYENFIWSIYEQDTKSIRGSIKGDFLNVFEFYLKSKIHLTVTLLENTYFPGKKQNEN